MDIKQHLVIFLKTMQAFTEYGLDLLPCKTLITAMLVKTHAAIRKHGELHDIFNACDSLYGNVEN